MYITNEYSELKENNGGTSVVLKPGVLFDAFSGDYTVTAFARIKNEKGEIVEELNPGEKITGVGAVARPVRPRPKPKTEPALKPEQE